MVSSINAIGELPKAAWRHWPMELAVSMVASMVVFGDELRDMELETSQELEGDASGIPLSPRLRCGGAAFMVLMSSAVRTQSLVNPISSP